LLSSAKALEAVDQIVNEVEQAIVKLQLMNTNSTGNVDHPSNLAELKAKLNKGAQCCPEQNISSSLRSLPIQIYLRHTEMWIVRFIQ
jgi:hypothetical protein